MTENASNSFSRKKRKKKLVFPKNAEKNASTIEKGLENGRTVAFDHCLSLNSFCYIAGVFPTAARPFIG